MEKRREVEYEDLEIFQEYSNSNRTQVTVLALNKKENKIFIYTFDYVVDVDNHLRPLKGGPPVPHDWFTNSEAGRKEAEEAFEDTVRSLKSLLNDPAA